MTGATIIDAGQRVRGELSGPGDVRIRGHFEGRIHVSGSVWVDDGGTCKAEVTAGRVRVDGLLDGKVRASRQVSIGPVGTLRGDVWGMLAVDEGGVFQGRIVPDSDEKLTTHPGGQHPRRLKVDHDSGGPLRLATKRRVTQPSAEAVRGPGSSGSLRSVDPRPGSSGSIRTLQPRPASSGSIHTLDGAPAASSSGSMSSGSEGFNGLNEWVATGHDSRPGAPVPTGLKTPRRLVAMPRQEAPLIDEAPPPAPSSHQMRAVSASDLGAPSKGPVPPRRDSVPPAPVLRTAASPRPGTDPPREPEPPSRATNPPQPAREVEAPPLLAHVTPPRPLAALPASLGAHEDPAVDFPGPAGLPTPRPTSPQMEALHESWFEEPDFLVKKAGASGEHDALDSDAPAPRSRRQSPPTKKGGGRNKGKGKGRSKAKKQTTRKP